MRGTNWLERFSGFALAGLFLLALTVVSGSASAQTSGTWSTTGSLNIERTRPTATLLANGEVLVVGGEDSAGVLTSAEVYNPSTGMWSTTGTLATPRLNHTATLLPNGQVLVAGGNPGTGYTASAELYNPSTGKWSMTGSMTVPRVRWRCPSREWRGARRWWLEPRRNVRQLIGVVQPVHRKMDGDGRHADSK